MKRIRSLKGVSIAAVLAAALVAGVVGLAYWTAPGSGSAGALVSTLSSPSPTATSPAAATAHIAWSPVTLVPSAPETDDEVTFTVERKPSSGSSWTFVCGTETTPKPYDVLSCDDSPPATDSYDYRVTATFRTWTSSGVSSVAVVVDDIPPTSTITFPGLSVYSAAGWDAGCSSQICGTAADIGGSGLQQVDVSIRQGAGDYWNGSAFASASEAWNLTSGTSSWSYAFPASSFPADGQYTVSSRATDNASNVQFPLSMRTFTIDRTAPSVTASVIAATVGTSPAGFVRAGAGYAVYADVSDANGVGSVTADVSNVTTGASALDLTTCVSDCTVGGHTYLYKSAPQTATGSITEGSKSYTVSAVDVVDNASAAASFAVVVDNTGPSISTVIAATVGTNPTGFVKQGAGYRVYANVSDLPAGAGMSSGVDVSTIAANVTNITAGTTSAPLTACGACGPGSAYAYQSAVLTASNPLSEGSKSYTVTAADNLATSGSSSAAAAVVDNTGPSISTVIAATIGTNPTGFVKQGAGYRVYANVTDLPAGAGMSSGVDVSTIAANVTNITAGTTSAPLTACGTCGPDSAYAYQSAVLTASNPLSEGSKSYTVTAADNLATSGSSSAAAAVVDNTAPSVATVLANTTTDQAGSLRQGGTYRVYANVTDLPAGGASGVNVSSITANVASVSAGQTAVALSTSGCPCTISGTTYAYRTAVLTADNPLSIGAKSFTTSASDNLASTTAQGGSVTVDNTAPALTALEMFDTDGNGRVDRVTATFGETLYTYSADIVPWTLANAPGGVTNTLASVATASNVATLTLNEGNVNTASGAFTVALAANAAGIRDAAGNLSSFVATPVVDRARPVAVDVQAVDGPGTAGRIDNGDVITYTFSEPMAPGSIRSGWSGASVVVDVQVGNSGSNDTIAVVGANLGLIATGGDYVSFLTVTVDANMVLSGSTVRVTITNVGLAALVLNTVPSSTMVWTPSTAVTDPAGNAMLGTARTQSGAPKRNF